MEKMIERVKGFILSPKETWDEIKFEPTTDIEIIKDYLVFIAAVPAISGFFGSLFAGGNFFRAAIWAIFFWGSAIGGVWIAAKIINSLTKSFKAESDFLSIFKLLTGSFTPILLAGVWFLIPPLFGLSVIGIYGFYLFWIGFPKFIICDELEQFNFSIISIIIFIIMLLVIFTIPALISGTSVYYLKI